MKEHGIEVVGMGRGLELEGTWGRLKIGDGNKLPYHPERHGY